MISNLQNNKQEAFKKRTGKAFWKEKTFPTSTVPHYKQDLQFCFLEKEGRIIKFIQD